LTHSKHHALVQEIGIITVNYPQVCRLVLLYRIDGPFLDIQTFRDLSVSGLPGIHTFFI